MLFSEEQDMKISLTEFKNNMNKYIELSSEEDIYLTKNRKKNHPT